MRPIDGGKILFTLDLQDIQIHLLVSYCLGVTGKMLLKNLGFYYVTGR